MGTASFQSNYFRITCHPTSHIPSLSLSLTPFTLSFLFLSLKVWRDFSWRRELTSQIERVRNCCCFRGFAKPFQFLTGMRWICKKPSSQITRCHNKSNVLIKCPERVEERCVCGGVGVWVCACVWEREGESFKCFSSKSISLPDCQYGSWDLFTRHHK